MKLCILGCGNYSKVFSQSIQPLLPDLSLYFASRNITKARTYCEMFNGNGVFETYQQAMQSDQVDAVYICTPHHLHLEHASMAIEAGKHVLVEKPIANNLDNARQMISLSKKNKVILMVAENYRFMPIVRLCKKLTGDGVIGDVKTIQMYQESSYQPLGWRKDLQKNGGGVFIDAGIHQVTFLRYLLGQPHYIHAVEINSNDKPDQPEIGVIVVAEWSTGERGLIYHAANLSIQNTKHWVTVSGNEGNIQFDLTKQLLTIESYNEIKTITVSEPTNGILEMVREFTASILQCREPETSGIEGLMDLSIVNKAYESIEKHEILALD